MPTDYGVFYKFIRGILRLFSRKVTVQDFRVNKESPVVYVSHHQNMFGPIGVLTWYPEFLKTWVFSVFLDYKSSYQHYVNYTLTKRFGCHPNLAKFVAAPLALFMATLTKSGRTIPVYRQSRQVLQTMDKTVEALENGISVLIFPDVDYSDNGDEVKEIYDGFLYIEKYYYRKMKQHIPFVPIIAVKNTNEIRVGEPIFFAGDDHFFKEKKRVSLNIQQSLNELANIPIEQPVSRVN